MKKVKMVLYGEPGVGKSVFACHAPNPFFICTDGNYEWLEDFGADMDAHINVHSWTEIKEAFADTKNIEKYDTIVVDLLEDAFKWDEQEYCTKNKLDHVSDVGYGKGYDITRNEFFIEVSKLLSYDKNIILIMHGSTVVVKDRRGVEHTKHVPSPRIPDKVIDMIEGRVRYFLRCYTKDEVFEDGTVEKKRYLSLVPKPNEFGIIRGVNENTILQDIPLDWSTFIEAIGLSTPNEVVKKEKPKPVIKEAEKTIQVKDEVEKQVEPEEEQIEEKPKPTRRKVVKSEPEHVEEEKTEEPTTSSSSSEMTQAEKIAAIKAKLKALNKG